LQNIPIRNEDGRKIREAFIPQDGYVLMSLDYSQIELRLLAHVGKIDKLAEAFRNGNDIHTATAMEIFDLTQETMTAEHRRRAKAINFGIIYGISAYGLSEQLGISRSDAAQYIKVYLERYPGISKYMEKYKEFAKQNGYVLSMFGRKCHVPGIYDKNPAIRGFAERQAINAPLQGTTADIAKKAMIQVDKLIINEALDAKLLLQVHDELLLEVNSSQQEKLGKKFKQTMENIVQLDVPLIVDVGTGTNWNEAH
jgi:DNA polymerase-1